MPLTNEQMDAKVDEHFRFEATDDIEGVLGTLADGVEHDVVGWPGGATHGREASRAFYQTMFADLADSQVRTLRRLYGNSFVVDESLWRGRAAGRPFGLEGRDRPLEFRLLHVMEFDDSGAITRENVWLDLAAIIAHLPQDSSAVSPKAPQ